MTRVLAGATLIDGTGAAPVPDAAVVIDGDRITAAGPRGAITWPPDAELIDARGRGLTDGEATPFVDFYTQALDLLTYCDEQAG
jgi:imidazolonepropionase-like amidohydrolase